MPFQVWERPITAHITPPRAEEFTVDTFLTNRRANLCGDFAYGPHDEQSEQVQLLVLTLRGLPALPIHFGDLRF